jgi:hypothetical protein
MPMLISTPEEYFREKQEDFFEFAYCGPINNKNFYKYRDAFNAWWEERFPEHPVTRLGPSEYSGWILGGPSMSTTPPDEAVRQAFLEKWTYKKSPWKLVEHRYADWLSAVQSCQIVSAPLQERRRVRYWQRPEGPLLLSQNTSGELLSRADARWWFSHDMPGHSADARTKLVSGEYFYYPPSDRAKEAHRASIDWEVIEELYAAQALEKSPAFMTWLRETLSIPDGEALKIITDP